MDQLCVGPANCMTHAAWTEQKHPSHRGLLAQNKLMFCKARLRRFLAHQYYFTAMAQVSTVMQLQMKEPIPRLEHW